MAQATGVSAGRVRAYTLIEMMIVVVILIIVMALIAPVIGNARNAAKRTNTQQLLSNLSQASQQFELSERRLPGYFNEADMGSQENVQRGFPSLANIMLDLAGAVWTGTGAPPTDAILVGPRAGAARAAVRVSLIGSPTQTKGVVNKGYFTPDPKYFVLHQDPASKIASASEHFQVPDLIDGFGQPILAWRQDIEPNLSVDFARIDADGARASFYRASNNAFIFATKLGAKGTNQDVAGNPPDAINVSLLSYNTPTVETTLAGLLGHPSFPATTVPNTPQIPAAARGRLVFHAAGADGVYLGTRDRGGVISRASVPGDVQNAVNYHSGRDPLDNFDDVVSIAGN